MSIIDACRSLLGCFSGEDIDFPECDLIVNPLGDGFGVYFFLLLVEYRHYFLFGVCQILVFLVGGIEIELAHLVRFQGNFKEIDDLDELVHA